MADDRLAYSLREAAEKLGGVSLRTVQRLVACGGLPAVRVGRRVLIAADALRRYVAAPDEVAHNQKCAEPVAWKGSSPCYSNAQGLRSGMSASGTQAARELSGLLVRLTGGKQGSLKGNGG